MNTITITYDTEDDELLNLQIRDVTGICDYTNTHDTPVDALYIARGDDGNIYGFCERCWEKFNRR